MFEVQCHAGNAALKFEQLTGHTLLQSVDIGNAVSDRDYSTDIGKVQLGFIMLELLLDDTGDFIWS